MNARGVDVFGHRGQNNFFVAAPLSAFARTTRFPDRGCRRARRQGSQRMTTLAITTTTLPSRLATLLRGDARHFQIAALMGLLAFNLGWIDFGAKPLNSLLAVLSALATQWLCTRIWRLPALDLRSPLITGLSLSLLLRADEPWIHAAAAAIAIASKFVLRIA